MTMASSSSSSLRFQRLLEVIEKALTQSRKNIDVAKLIQQCYGEDASIFAAQQGDNVLLSVLEGMLDRVHDSVTEDMLEFLKELQVEAKLIKFEEIATQLEMDEVWQQQQETNDKQSARRALEDAKLPKELKPADIVTYCAYQKILSERDGTLSEIAAIEKEIQQLAAQQADGSTRVESKLETVQAVGKELELSADMCSTVS
jgi:hypothetical protein